MIPEIEKLGAIRLKKLQKHLKNFDLSSKLTRIDLDDFASDLMLILKGPPTSLLDYFTSKKSARMKMRLARTVQEDMLLMGLKGLINRIPEKTAYSRLENGKYLTHRFFQYKIWKYLVLPYDLPWIEHVQIPDELLERIIVDGLDAHEQELITLLKKQDMIDHYERFRKVYRPIAFAVGFYMYYDKFSSKMNGKLNETQEEERKKLIRDFTELGEKILEVSEVPDKTVEEVKEEHFQRLLRRYEMDNGQRPSKEEYIEIRAKVFN